MDKKFLPPTELTSSTLPDTFTALTSTTVKKNDEKICISPKSLKRALEDEDLAGPSSKEAKNGQSPSTSSVFPTQKTSSVPVVIQTANGTEWKPEKGKLIGSGTLTEDRLAELLAVTGTAPVRPGEDVHGPVLTFTQASKLGELLDLEYIKQLEEEDEDEDVAAVLGDCSDKECSYDKGYMKRQALYSCVTCYKKTQEVAGICLACTYACHDGHEFVELYTKRNFRCDCGNSKFSGLSCQLTPQKDILNEKNEYNQNFLNSYCVCKRPYPDPEREEMVQVQCTFCEDWFHLPHLLKDTTDLEALMEVPKSLVCVSCRQEHPFVNYYIAEESDMVAEFDATLEECQIDGCGLKFLQKKFEPLAAIEEGGWTPLDWYNSVCKCDSCKKLYAKEKVEFLLDYEESVSFHEEKGRAKVEQEKRDAVASMAGSSSSDSSEAMQELLHRLDRVQQIEFASTVTDLKSSLASYLDGITTRGEIVQVEHITEFFEKEQKKLRDRLQQRQSGDQA